MKFNDEELTQLLSVEAMTCPEILEAFMKISKAIREGEEFTVDDLSNTLQIGFWAGVRLVFEDDGFRQRVIEIMKEANE